MDSLDMPMELAPLGERPLAAKVCADKTFPKVNRLEVLAHVVDAYKHLVAGFIIAGHSLGTLDTIGWRRLLLAALGNMSVVIVLR